MAKHNLATLAGWRTAVAEAFATVYDAQNRAGSSLGSALSSVGIAVKDIKSEANGLTVELPEPDGTENLPHGFARGDLSAEKLAEIDAATLADAKRQAYNFIVRKHRNGYWSEAEAVRVCEMLGFTQRPIIKTQISASVPTGRTDRYGDRLTDYVSFTVDGNLTEEEVTAKLAEVFPDTSANAQVMRAFGLTPPQHISASVTHDNAWPSYDAS